jgi:putative ABC transport system permease protein
MNDLRIATRSLLKNPSFSLVAVLSLALGIGANTAIFTVVKSVLLSSLPYRDPQRVVILSEADPKTPQPITTSYGTYLEWKSRTKSFASIELYRGWGGVLRGQGDPEMLEGMRVTSGFFRMLGVRPIHGRDFASEEDTPQRRFVILLSYGFWQRRFGASPAAIGQSLVIDGRSYHIVGVLPADFRPTIFNFSERVADIWAPLGYAASDPFACRTCQHLRAAGRLRQGVTFDQANADINAAYRAMRRDFPNDYGPDGYVKMMPLRNAVVGRLEQALWVLTGAVAVLLLISCANVANLCLARASSRLAEFSVRAAIGAGRGRLIRQLLVEYGLLSLIAGSLGAMLAIWGVPLLLTAAPQMPRLDEVSVDWQVLLFCLGVALATTMLFGLAPAMSASRVDLRGAFANLARISEARRTVSIRAVLAGAQVALAFLLLAGSGLLLRSFLNLWRVDPGFNPGNLLVLRYSFVGDRYRDNAALVEATDQLLARLKAVPGVESAAVAATLPFNGFDRGGLHIRDRNVPASEVPSTDRYQVSPGYSRAMGIPLLRGRLFTEGDSAQAARVALIGETAARQIWPGEDPIGKQIQIGGRNEKQPWHTIVGIVGDVRQYGFDRAPTVQAYVPASQSPFTYPTWLIRSSVDPASLERSLRGVFTAFDNSNPVTNVRIMEEDLAQSLAERRYILLLLSLFAGLAVTIALIGIYGVLAYTVSRRTHEIGIRVAIGATLRDVSTMVLRQGATCIGGGLIVGTVTSLAFTGVLESMLFGVRPADALTLITAALVLATAGLLAAYVPARRAAKVNPIEALRHE